MLVRVSAGLDVGGVTPAPALVLPVVLPVEGLTSSGALVIIPVEVTR